MRKGTEEFLNRILTLTLISISFYFFYTAFIVDPCDNIITYRIGNIDSRFGLTNTDALKYAQDSAELWNKGLNKQVLKYDPEGEVEITFVYDERQRKTIKNNILKEQAQKQSKTLGFKNEEILVKKENFEQLEQDYNQRITNFNTTLGNYNQKVNTINQRGGATEAEARVLDTERRNLENLRDSLEQRSAELKNYLSALNSSVQNYNSNIREVNSVIKEINENSLGEFEQGNYTRKNSEKKITLYEYENVTTLKRLIAHEFGHALGLDHTDNPNSIMYYINEGDKLNLAPEDIQEYNKICDKK